MKSSSHTSLALLLAAFVLLVAGCARQPVTGVTSIKASNPAALQRQLLAGKHGVAEFRLRGPFTVDERSEVDIPVSSDLTVRADLFLAAASGQGPLVIIVHGQENSKDDHAFQAMHVASWGMHGMAVQLPNQGPWIANGRILARLVNAIRKMPRLGDGRIDAGRIVLVGHSFGATAVAAALGEGAPAVGGVLLDPAGIGRQLPDLLRRIRVPTMIIGADEEIWPTRNRSYFFRFIPRNVGEISIRDAVHEDAQYPREFTLRLFEDRPMETEAAQITFVSALTAAAFALSATGGIDYAWESYEEAVRSGQFFHPRRK